MREMENVRASTSPEEFGMARKHSHLRNAPILENGTSTLPEKGTSSGRLFWSFLVKTLSGLHQRERERERARARERERERQRETERDRNTARDTTVR
jgi:hypothetical protein